MPDYGSKIADKAIDQTARKIRGVYKDAWFDIRKKMDDFTKRHIKKNAELMKKLEAGEITKAEYDSWMRGQVFMGKQWDMKLDQIAKVMDNANKEAVGVVRNGSFNVFAENYNHTAYELEKRVGGAVNFNLYNGESVARLLKKNPKMLPEWKINERKDYSWNRKKVENAITQGIIQGEGIDKITDRLADALITTNENRMRTFARTGITGAQNAGRLKQMEDAEEMGIKVKKRWIATLDSRTRDTHQELDGQEVPVDEPFEVDGMEIMYPGDPNAEPELVYNCRCTMIEIYEGIDRKSIRRDEDDNAVEDMTYKEWKKAKEDGTLNTENKLVEPAIGKAKQREQEPLKATQKVEYGELFNQAQMAETSRTLDELSNEIPLEKPLNFVGDARLIHDDIPNDADHLDIASDPDLEKKYGGIAAHYYRRADGSTGIEIFDESLETHSLKEDFDIRHALREKYMDANGMLSESNLLDTVSGTVEGTIRHEYCHAVQDQYIISAMNAGDKDALDFVDRLFKYYEDNKENVMQISKYAATHPFEMVSEAFVQIQDTAHPNTVATRTAKEIWSMVTDFMHKKGVR